MGEREIRLSGNLPILNEIRDIVAAGLKVSARGISLPAQISGSLG
jgi:hypothetical protein